MKKAENTEVVSDRERHRTAWTAENLRQENKVLMQRINAYERKCQSLEVDFKSAELVRLNSEVGQLNEEIDRMSGHIQALRQDMDDTHRKVNYYRNFISKIKKKLGVTDKSEILPALSVLKKSKMRSRSDES